MDLIKETYSMLLKHLGEDTPRGRKIPEQYSELKKEFQRLIGFAFDCGRTDGQTKTTEKFSDANRELVEQVGHELRQMQRQLVRVKSESEEDK